MFDYWYYDETSDSRGNRNRRYRRFTCALVTIPAACPRLRLAHENFLTRLGDHLGLRDVECEYADFNRRFQATSSWRTRRSTGPYPASAP